MSQLSQFNFDPNWLHKQYVVKQKSTVFISKEIGCSPALVYRKLKKFGIVIRSQTDKQYKKIMSKRSKKLWENPKFKQHQIDSHNTKEYKEKASKSFKKLWKNNRYKKKTLNAIRTKENRNRISNNVKTTWETKNGRNKMMEAFTDKRRKKISKRMKELMKNPIHRKKALSYLLSKENQEAVSNRNARNWKDPKYKEKMSEVSRKLWEDPELRKKIKKKISIASKAMWEDPGYREKMAVIRSQQPRISSIQRILYSILDDLGIEYEIEKPIGFYTFDCFIPKYNILIECQGDYWHSLKEAIRNDKAKATYIERYFPQYQLKCLWEHEFYAKDRITGVIKHWLGLDKMELVGFEFNDVEIKKVKHSEVKLLLSKYHYLQNAGNGGIIYGAYLKDEKDENDKNDELIACCVFSPPTRKEIATRLNLQPKEIRELSRFCIHPSYQKKNFGSWFISRCLKDLKSAKNYKLVVSFCDTTYNHDGALYKATNFKLDGKTKPGYWYIDKDGYVMHKKTLYQKAVMMKMKERKYAEKNGYIKVWGKEKLRFTYKF